MSELWTYAEVGFRHIADIRAADHILFLLVLAAIYRGGDWRSALWVISAFTVGHSLTLALSVTDILVLNSSIVEFLIPVTIVLTGLENLWLQRKAASATAVGTADRRRARYRPVLAGVFGLVHGAGFAGYLRSLFVDDIAVPLLGFNIGIELGQIVVLSIAAAAYAMVDLVLRVFGARIWSGSHSPFKLRVVAVSVSVSLIATAWAWERLPL